MHPKLPYYQAFVLRMWLDHEPDHQAWRFSLEDTQTGERLGFANLERLAHFLIGRMKAADAAPPKPK